MRAPDAAYRGQEAHVEHTVRLIEDQDLDTRKSDRAPLHVIEQPSGGGDEDVDTAAQGPDLFIHADAAVSGLRAQRHVPAIVAGSSGQLGRRARGPT